MSGPELYQQYDRQQVVSLFGRLSGDSKRRKRPSLPPRVTKITVTHESTTDRLTVDGTGFHFRVPPVRRWIAGCFDLRTMAR
jgi:hypothetical protein